MSDPLTGWTNIRPFHPDLWLHLSAAHNCCFLWSSATCNDAMLERICEAFTIQREEVAVLQMNIDRPNIYQQMRPTKKAFSIG